MDIATAYTQLRLLILSGSVLPGERLVSQQIADEIGASRTPVREALARLESQGLVVRTDKWGYAVRSMTLNEAEHLFESRLVIEVANARFAAERATSAKLAEIATTQAAARSLLQARRLIEFQHASRRMHELVAEGASNTQLLRMFQQINDLVILFGVTLLRASPSRAEEILAENQLICDAITAHDDAAAADAMRAHITRGHQHFRQSLADNTIELKIA
ncbi:GntR family transcriptional regulator [Cupriavidus taiwanensis]|uniref:GntR family transcriptional regulator n=1 Tax=Cupriavidus taiwanensis TaxID=164546 RepID=UPI000E13E075|nr:GntR family transcriptional regulator [Cupriavidus taiwanensis]SOZ20107.1 GntR family transcriptional regulator [Cupriavidus taiwanensis]SOZ33329.1 GntR family transcriptional regulator [Cupriavidus taiwanensis]SOZ48645.1 GntR family transcriptional regulator [Cupriavidus taiwanensis]